jgi:hypothetical protein
MKNCPFLAKELNQLIINQQRRLFPSNDNGGYKVYKYVTILMSIQRNKCGISAKGEQYETTFSNEHYLYPTADTVSQWM